jgi:hypothetical protein
MDRLENKKQRKSRDFTKGDSKRSKSKTMLDARKNGSGTIPEERT